ncbi:MAG: glycosyltransferase family A protein, partial [Nitrosospira sp.]
MKAPSGILGLNLEKNKTGLPVLSPAIKYHGHTEPLAVSICVCTYRRAHLLPLLLDSLAKQSFSERFEVIVVDNDKMASAAKVVEAGKKRHPDLNIQYTVEVKKGISFARNTAALLATGNFLAWIDDDETAGENWLISLWISRSINDADAVFGPVIPVFP